ncbi:MAG: SufE family protein [Pseudomonadota bacterium]
MEGPTQSDQTTTAEVQRSIVDSFQFLGDWTERYQYLIDLGRRLPAYPDAKRTDDYRLYGCQSGVWLDARYEDGKLDFEAASDSAIVAGIIALLLKVYSGRRPHDILTTSPTFIDDIGLSKHLSPHRANGLSLMLERIRTIASAHAAGGGSGGSV